MTLIETIIKTLEKEYDDIIWDFGVDDPRLADLGKQLIHYKKLSAAGELYEPDF